MTTFYRNLLAVALLLCSGLCRPAWAQQPTLPAAPPARTLLTKADTVAALQDMFREKRKNNGLFLAAVPLTLGVTVVGIGAGVSAVLDGSGRTDGTFPVIGICGGIVGSALLINRHTRYTRGSEKQVIDRYERKNRLPRWAKRNLQEQLRRPAG